MADKKEVRFAIKKFDLAWQEYFKDKPKPENDEEDRKQQAGFYYWYNNIRKQSDTGKTPAEMYKEIYDKEPPEENRMMNFEWDEDYDEEEDFDDLEKELWEMSSEMFDEDIWNKEEMKDLSRRELAKTMFGLGFIIHQRIMDEEIKEMEEKIIDNPEFAKKSLEILKKNKDKKRR